MNEFLQNLRSSQKSYSNGNRKTYDGYYHHPNRDRRSSDYNRRVETRRQSGREMEQLSGVLSDLVPLVRDLVPKFVETFERIAESREKLILAEERKTAALEKITTSLAQMVSSESQPLKKVLGPTEVPAQTVQDPQGFKLDKETAHKSAEKNRKNVIEIIKKMRDENCTYDHIAQYLTEHQYPTFSHRGEWHAQTVHRLFKKGYSE